MEDAEGCEVIPSLDTLIDEAKGSFLQEFGTAATHCASAPGRVNLIGEHVDYCGGFVLPMALPLATVVVGAGNDNGSVNGQEESDDRFCVVSTSGSFAGESRFSFTSRDVRADADCPKWAKYILGVMDSFHEKDAIPGFKALVHSSVPIGGGLSSSASLEVAFYTFLESLTGSTCSSQAEKALSCQRAEHLFAGMPCGIMDQFVSVMGAKDCAVLIDCRSMEVQKVPLDPDVAVLVVNSNVKHQLTGSEYPSRRKDCENAAKILAKSTLRDATLEEASAALDKYSTLYRRTRHVITEIRRTKEAAAAFQRKDYQETGRLMVESHESLRDDFEVSCPEQDSLVEIAMSVSDVFGSRMTGGGFGGCTVTLVRKEAVAEVVAAIKDRYEGNPTFFVCTASDGAKIIQI